MTITTELQDVERIIVLDYGSQYNQLISRRIREIGVFSELKSNKITAAEVSCLVDQILFMKKVHLISTLKFWNWAFRF